MLPVLLPKRRLHLLLGHRLDRRLLRRPFRSHRQLHPLVLLVVGSGLLHSNRRMRVSRPQQELSLQALLVPLVPLTGNNKGSPQKPGLSPLGEYLALLMSALRC